MRSDKGRPSILGIITTLLMLTAAILASSGQSSAGDGLKVVRGYVTDSAGRNITDATVLVIIWDPTKTTQRSSLSEPTDENGFYSVQFSFDDWYVGDYIEVICTYSGEQVVENTTAISSSPIPWQWVNLTFPFEIPEFGSAIGFIVAGGAIGAVAMVALLSTQRKRSRD